jgi:hypothetical protein
MYNPDTDLLFPPRVLPALRELRGEQWQELVRSVIASGPDSLEVMALILMMARMNNCATCNSDSYRAMNGCTICSKQSLKRTHVTDVALTEIFQSARGEVEQYIRNKTSFTGDPLNHHQPINR